MHNQVLLLKNLKKIKKAIENEKSKENNKPKSNIESDSSLRKPAIYIHVDRDTSVQIARLKLPILAEEQQIMELIRENLVVIIAGENWKR